MAGEKGQMQNRIINRWKVEKPDPACDVSVPPAVPPDPTAGAVIRSGAHHAEEAISTA